MDLVIGGRHFSCLVIAEQMQVIIETNPSHYRMNVETFRQSRPHHAIGKSFWFSDDNWQRTVNNQNWFLDLKKFAQMLHGIEMFVLGCWDNVQSSTPGIDSKLMLAPIILLPSYCSHYIVQFWTCCWSSAKVMFGWTQFFSEGLIAVHTVWRLILREE